MRDESAVSEVIGYIMVFAIVSILLVLGMLAFNKAASDARRNVVDLRAQSVGTRIAGLVVQASLLAEREGSTTSVRFMADLPADLEGYSYTVYLEPAVTGANAHPERVRVTIPALAIDDSAPVFSADAPTSFTICGASGTSAPGGHVSVAFNVDAYSGQTCLFVEPSP